MLKTLSTESAEPRKRVVGVDGGGRNRAESVGKHEVDGDEGVGCSSDLIQSFMVILTWPFKSPAGALDIIHLQESLNSLTEKNRYSLPLIKALPSGSKYHFQQKKVRFLDRRATYFHVQNELINKLIN